MDYRNVHYEGEQRFVHSGYFQKVSFFTPSLENLPKEAATRKDYPLDLDTRSTSLGRLMDSKFRVIEKPSVLEAYTINVMWFITAGSRGDEFTSSVKLVASSVHSEARIRSYPSEILVVPTGKYQVTEGMPKYVKRLVLFKQASIKQSNLFTFFKKFDGTHITSITVDETPDQNIVMFTTDSIGKTCYLADENNKCECTLILGALLAKADEYQQKRDVSKGSSHEKLVKSIDGHASRLSTCLCYQNINMVHFCMLCGNGLKGGETFGKVCDDVFKQKFSDQLINQYLIPGISTEEQKTMEEERRLEEKKCIEEQARLEEQKCIEEQELQQPRRRCCIFRNRSLFKKKKVSRPPKLWIGKPDDIINNDNKISEEEKKEQIKVNEEKKVPENTQPLPQTKGRLEKFPNVCKEILPLCVNIPRTQGCTCHTSYKPHNYETRRGFISPENISKVSSKSMSPQYYAKKRTKKVTRLSSRNNNKKYHIVCTPIDTCEESDTSNESTSNSSISKTWYKELVDEVKLRSKDISKNERKKAKRKCKYYYDDSLNRQNDIYDDLNTVTCKPYYSSLLAQNGNSISTSSDSISTRETTMSSNIIDQLLMNSNMRRKMPTESTLPQTLGSYKACYCERCRWKSVQSYATVCLNSESRNRRMLRLNT